MRGVPAMSRRNHNKCWSQYVLTTSHGVHPAAARVAEGRPLCRVRDRPPDVLSGKAGKPEQLLLPSRPETAAQRTQPNEPEGSVGKVPSTFSAFRLNGRNVLVFC